MFHSFLEILLSLLAVFGLFSLGWLCFGHVLAPQESMSTVYCVIPARGGGGTLEQTVKTLTFPQAGRCACHTVVIMDTGLNAEGRRIAHALVNQYPHVLLCPGEDISDYLL